MKLKTTLVAAALALITAGGAAANQLPNVEVNPNNASVREAFIETFTEGGKAEFVRIARCESGLVHYENGRLLRNREGSNARGILQLMTSVHPDPARIRQYNRRNGTRYDVNDFNLNDPEEYIQYAFLLASVRGTRDWNASISCWG